MWKTFARTTACLAISATAFIAVTRVDASAAAAKKSAPDTETTEPKPAPSTRKSGPPPKPAPTPAPKVTVTPTTTTTAATTAPPAGTGVDAVPVPDWKGKRLSLARREARKLGLTVSAVDETGEPVPAEMARSYRVRRQLAQIGHAVQLVVREIAETAEGY